MPPAETAFRVVDLEHMGKPDSVAACLLDTREGPVIVDPGPSSTLAKLEAGLAAAGAGLADVSAILLTHIHLDHAGASGTLARRNPRLRVYVHEAGAPHVIDPTKLLNSATRLYGDKMDALWGEVAAVDAGRVEVLRGDERLELGGRTLEVAYTPGHAWHHVSYFEAASGSAFVGDTAGIFGPRLPVVLPVTPPPDFDLEAWLGSIERILAWQPSTIVLTHFGPAADPAGHFATLKDGLIAWAGYARDSLAREGDDAERSRWFVGRLEEWIDGKVPPASAAKFLAGAGPDACWQGLARYWRRKG
ncbi:MAG TPA: MBL fold metallo-hydrolase [Gemmatimonadales bacterium]|nr:MBL fold metallo-hydrolase [Gemmatimonadales bacterium]